MDLTGFVDVRTQCALEKKLKLLPTSESFRDHLMQISSVPHPFGSAANRAVGEYLAEAMDRAGLDVATYDYDVYAPQLDTTCSVALVTPIRKPLNDQEYILKEDAHSGHPDLLPGWLAYTGSGDVTAEVVYVNYGRKEDFDRLRDLGASVAGKIVLARYGMNYRGYKSKYAEEAGAVGAIFYSDPADVGFRKGLEYPDGRFMNESGIQRGSLLTLPYPGDPLTPDGPAVSDAERLDPADVGFPKIPVAPLPYGSAVEILKRMTGTPAPFLWQGGLPFTYRLDGGSDLTVRLCVNQPCALTKATNVVGTLWGETHPDEWIILGCHYDAWAFGTSDPNSGTAMLLALADALGKMAKEGYRPKRTIRIAHWDAEEFGIMGSTEWVEQFKHEVNAKAVAYVNADMAATGATFVASASPSLKGTIAGAAKHVDDPGGSGSVYDAWLNRITTTNKPMFANLGGGSDHLPFYVHAGVPSAALSMSGWVTVYHSVYDSPAWYERFGDPDYTAGPAMARVNGLVALRLANADVLPYSVGQYAVDFKVHLEDLQTRCKTLDVSFDTEGLMSVCGDLQKSADRFKELRNVRLAGLDAAQLDKVNRQLIGLERAWLHSDGMQKRPWSQSLFGAEDPTEGYAPWMLPGLRWEVEQKNSGGLIEWVEIYAQAVKRLATQIDDISDLLG